MTSMRSTISDVIVIGAGAAGLMAAGTAAGRGLSVTVLEKTDHTARKLGITGKGRCNLTNFCSLREAVSNIPGNGKFMYSALSDFPPQKVMELFESLGVPLKVERGKRVFPVSDRAADVVDALRRFAQDSGAELVRSRAVGIITDEGRASGVSTDRGDYYARSVILATGGLSYPVTGSDGDGYRMASAVGHRIVKPRASLVPLESTDDYCGRMAGFSPRNVSLRVVDSGGKRVFEDFGEMLFTHFGVSGPLVLSASAHMRDFDNNSYTMYIDLKPALDRQALDRRILRDFEKYKNRDFENALQDLAGRSMIPVLVELSGIPGDTKVNSVTREQRLGLVELFKAFPVHVKCPRPVEEAIVTSGGVDVKEVDPRTMESKLLPGLYFAGEVLDVDGYTGGFNLQIAWSTGHRAGMSVGKESE